MKISELMQAMSDAGAPMEAILIAVRAVEESNSQIDQKRAVERDRKRRQRANTPADGGTVTGQSRDKGRTVTGTVSLSLPPNEINSNPPTHTHENNKPARKGKSETPAKPDGVADQVWADFLDLRKRKSAPLSETALDGIRREATKAGWGLNDALAESVTRGWQAFKSDWVKDAAKPPGGVCSTGASPLLKSLIAKKPQQYPISEAAE